MATESVEHLATDLYHEVWHMLREHAARSNNYPLQEPDVMQKWLMSTDCEINDDIVKDEKMPMQDWVVLPEKFKDDKGNPFPDFHMAEEYMNMFPPTKMIKVGCKAVGGKDGCGSGQTGQGQEGEQGEPNKKNPGIGTAEGKMIQAKVAEDIDKHQKSIGNIPAGILRWVESILKPQVDWRKELGAMLRGAVSQVRGRMEYSFRHMSRRQPFVDIRLPSMVARIPRVAIQTDTSGSMSQGDLAVCIGEIDGILRTAGVTEAEAYSVDAAVGGHKKIRSAKQVEFTGGGGTDMGVGIEYAKTIYPKIDILVVLTDGATPWPEFSPQFKVIICIIGDSTGKGPEWAKTINIKTSRGNDG